MPISTYEILIASLLGTFVIINNMSCCLIKSHIANKPLGYETLFDKFLVKLLNADVVFSYTLSILVYYSICPQPLTPTAASVIYYIHNYVHDYVLCWFIVLVIFKYLCIFHPTNVEFDLSDDQVIKNVQITILAILTPLVFIDNLFISKIENIPSYQLMTLETSETGGKGLSKVSLYLNAILLISFLYTNYQIEFKLPNTFDKNERSKSVSTARWISVIALVTILFTIIGLIYIDISDDAQIFFTGVLIVLLHCVFPPIIFIWRSKRSLKTYVFNTLKRFVLCRDEMIEIYE